MFPSACVLSRTLMSRMLSRAPCADVRSMFACAAAATSAGAWGRRGLASARAGVGAGGGGERLLALEDRLNEGGSVLAREFVQLSLYHPTEGYFNQPNRISATGPQIDFSQLKDADAYRERLSEVYEQHKQGWTTPVEVFKPLYAEAIARWIVRSVQKAVLGAPVPRIVEVGCGLGTCAKGVLDFLQREHPAIYKDVRFTLVDASAELHARQKEALQPAHGDRCEFVCASAAEWKPTWELANGQECFVYGLELLDNMSHDLVKFSESGEAQQIEVRRFGDVEYLEDGGVFEEVPAPITDPLIQECWGYWLDVQRSQTVAESRTSLFLSMLKHTFIRSNAHAMLEASLKLRKKSLRSNSPVWLPTTALAFMKMLAEHVPRTRIFLADFSYLPGALLAHNAPVVSGRDPTSGKTVDHDTYLVPWGSADIFFITDFALLRAMYERVLRRPASVVSSRDFVLQYADHGRAVTQSGFNPMLEDYVNQSVLLSPPE